MAYMVVQTNIRVKPKWSNVRLFAAGVEFGL